MRRFLLTALLLASSSAAPQEPTFSAGTRLVQVDTVVRNSKGPVANLRKEDFSLLDNGKPQKIAVFSVRSARSSVASAVPLPAGAASNRLNSRGETPASATILLIDRLNTPISDQPYANRKIIKFLQNRGNRDSIGIYTLGNRVRVIQDLTNDPDRLDRAVKLLKPEDVARLKADVQLDPTGDAVTDGMLARFIEALEDFTVQNKVETTQHAFEDIARHLASVPGRKNLIWVSGSFPLFIQRAHYNVDSSPEMEKAARALNDANVAVYPVDARGLAGTLSLGGPVASAESNQSSKCPPVLLACSPPGVREPAGFDTMNFLAALTGGRAFYNTNGIEDSIGKAVEDAELTYTLGFYPPEASQDGTNHKLVVKVSARDVSVHHRETYLAFKANTAPRERLTLRQLLDDPLDATQIGLLAQAAPDESRPGSERIQVTIDLHDLQLQHESAHRTGEVAVSFFPERLGKVLTRTIRIDIPDDQFVAALQQGIVVIDAVETAGKPTGVRIVAQDAATGTAGSLRLNIGAE